MVKSTYYRTNGKSPGHMVLGLEMILPKNHVEYCRYIFQCKQTQIEEDLINKKTTRIDYNYRVGYWVMIREKSTYKYEILFKGPYEKISNVEKVTGTLWMGAVKIRINILHIKPYNNPNAE